jgi:Photosynthetic reaction centre cytochrome C subunit
MRRLALLVPLLILFSCTALRQQKTQPPRTDDLEFHNLQFLPPNIPRPELIAVMRGFTRALGVECGHCHVQTAITESKPDFDFASDAKSEKHAARIMIRMTRTINADYVSRIPEMYTTVTCWTCHRGQVQPAVQPSVEAATE